MKRSLITALVAVAAVAMTGCGQTPQSGVLVPKRSSALARPVGQTNAPAAGSLVGNNAASATGVVVLQLSSLKQKAYELLAKREDVAAVQIRMEGPGLAQPLVKEMTAEQLASSNTIAFEGVPVGAYTIGLAAFDASGANIGAKKTDVTVKANEEVEVKLQLKLNPSVATGKVAFSFDIVDGDEIIPDTDEDAEDEEPADEPEMDTDGMLAVEITDKQIVRKLLLLKRLAVTVTVTNENTTEPLSGEVKLEFYKEKGLFNKETALVETQTQTIKNLPPGKSVELTFQSEKSAEDAEATVHTVLSSASASTQD